MHAQFSVGRVLAPMAVFVCASGAFSDTILVPQDQPTIQKAINAASHGDEVIVAPGTYSEAIHLAGKSIVLRSEAGAEKTIIDASGVGRTAVTIASGEDAQTMIQGFTITGGKGTLVDGNRCGGGLFISGAAPTVYQCIVTGNAASRGGGAFIGPGGQPWIVETVFTQNSAMQSGGAMFVGPVSGAAGGVAVAEVGAHIVDSTFENNAAPTGAAVDVRTGIAAYDSVFTGNAAQAAGGAVIIMDSAAMFVGSTFTDNTERALVVESGGSASAIDCLFENNPDGAIAARSNLERCDLFVQSGTFRNNTGVNGAAIRTEGRIELRIMHSIFEGNAASGSAGAIHTFCAAGGDACPDVTIMDAVFHANAAANNGGAIATGCTMAQGQADCANIAISDSQFSRNAAGIFGGAVHNRCAVWTDPKSGEQLVHCGELLVERSTLTQNSAGAGGGAIANLDESVSVVVDSTMCQNIPESVLGDWEDEGGNDVAPAADLDCDGIVNVFDLLDLLGAWGQCKDDLYCEADLNTDGSVNVFDMLILLGNWG